MKKMILHIGAPKCGSSTIQTALGIQLSDANGYLNLDGEVLRYAALSPTGGVLTGPELLYAQRKSHLGYVASAAFPKETHEIRALLEALKRSIENDAVAVLSCEGWANGVDQHFFNAAAKFGVPVDVFMVTRAPVDWMNSSWWQWGVWTGNSVDSWVNSQLKAVRYFDQLQNWIQSGIVNRLNVVDLSQDFLGAFANFLKVPQGLFKTVARSNVATNFDLLRHLINNKAKYGRTVHEPSIEFFLNSVLRLGSNPPPWAISSDQAKKIIRHTHPASMALVDFLEEDRRPLAHEVRRKYLDPEYYSDYEHHEMKTALLPSENDVFIGQLVDAVIRMAGERNAG
ncbi:MAG: hypothetical protein IE937_12215 [Gammaproteobacteria bacterium]|nr:hypothetical protein [Gammaproteobacteria bacterium]